MSGGLSIGEFNSVRGEIATAAEFAALMEQMPPDSQFIKENEELQKSLKRTSEIWKAEFPDYPNVCNLKQNIGWNKGYCSATVVSMVKEEGLDIDPQQIEAGNVPLNNIVSAMLTSNSVRLAKAVEQFR